MSPTSTAEGTGGRSRLRTRSGRPGAPGSGTVVTFLAFCTTPRMPSSRMSFRTRWSVRPMPRAASRTRTVRAPNRPPEASQHAMTASRASAHGSERPRFSQS